MEPAPAPLPLRWVSAPVAPPVSAESPHPLACVSAESPHSSLICLRSFSALLAPLSPQCTRTPRTSVLPLNFASVPLPLPALPAPAGPPRPPGSLPPDTTRTRATPAPAMARTPRGTCLRSCPAPHRLPPPAHGPHSATPPPPCLIRNRNCIRDQLWRIFHGSAAGVRRTERHDEQPPT